MFYLTTHEEEILGGSALMEEDNAKQHFQMYVKPSARLCPYAITLKCKKRVAKPDSLSSHIVMHNALPKRSIAGEVVEMIGDGSCRLHVELDVVHHYLEVSLEELYTEPRRKSLFHSLMRHEAAKIETQSHIWRSLLIVICGKDGLVKVGLERILRRQITFDTNGKILVAGNEHCVKFWDVNFEERFWTATLSHEPHVSSIKRSSIYIECKSLGVDNLTESVQPIMVCFTLPPTYSVDSQVNYLGIYGCVV
ncbi:hypothetical protein Tco_1517541 [Tanacetum coccineum]